MASQFSVRLEGLDRLLASMNSSEFVEAVARGVESAAHRARTVLIRETRRKAFDNGALAASWAVDTVQGVGSATGEVECTVSSASQYASTMEEGRRPGGPMPPIQPLGYWAHRKLRGGRRSRTQWRDDLKRLGFMVARAIQKHGIKARNIVSGKLDDLGDMAAREVMHELQAFAAGRAGGGTP